jgi:hypothetical protein
VSHVSASTMFRGAAQADVQCDPSVLTGNLTSPHENQACPREGGSSRNDTQAHISIASMNGSFDTLRTPISPLTLALNMKKRRTTNHQ